MYADLEEEWFEIDRFGYFDRKEDCIQYCEAEKRLNFTVPMFKAL